VFHGDGLPGLGVHVPSDYRSPPVSIRDWVAGDIHIKGVYAHLNRSQCVSVTRLLPNAGHPSLGGSMDTEIKASLGTGWAFWKPELISSAAGHLPHRNFTFLGRILDKEIIKVTVDPSFHSTTAALRPA